MSPMELKRITNVLEGVFMLSKGSIKLKDFQRGFHDRLLCGKKDVLLIAFSTDVTYIDQQR